MDDYKKYLDETGEIGEVTRVYKGMVYASGLPGVRQMEMVVFKSGIRGLVLSMEEDYVEVMLLSLGEIMKGEKLTRCNDVFKIGVTDKLLGKTLLPTGFVDDSIEEYRIIDEIPLGIRGRKKIDSPLETGVSIVDLVIPIGKGQKELVIGDRKTNKTQFLLQVMLTQARKGMICIYSAIAKRVLDIKMIENFIKNYKILDNTVVVASSASDSTGLIYLTPYTAMTIAEYFRDKGRDVLLILDDLTAHAKCYREMTLLAGRFPGRSSYPGDVFYLHSRLLERAGNFLVNTKDPKSGTIIQKETSITCLPVGELVMGDLTGYIQTNLMSMTDGHIYFDKDYFDEGRRPAINPFISVTRVGRQAQSPLLRDLNSRLASFLVKERELKQFLHFGAELSDETKKVLDMGRRFQILFDQTNNVVIDVNVNIFIAATIFGGLWKDSPVGELKKKFAEIIASYGSSPTFRKNVDAMVSSYQTVTDLINIIKEKGSTLFPVGEKKY